MLRIWEQSAEEVRYWLSIVLPRHHVLHPIERLNDAHARTSGPIETAGRCRLEMDDLLSKDDRLQAGVDQDLDARRDGRGEAEIIRGSLPVDHNAGLVAARHSLDDGAIVGDSQLAREIALSRPVVEATIDAAQLASRCSVLSTAARLPRSTKSPGVHTSVGEALMRAMSRCRRSVVGCSSMSEI